VALAWAAGHERLTHRPYAEKRAFVVRVLMSAKCQLQTYRCLAANRRFGSQAEVSFLNCDVPLPPASGRCPVYEYTPFCNGPDEVKSPEETRGLDLDQIMPPNGLSYATILEEWTNDWNGFFAKLVSVFKVTQDFYEDAEEWLALEGKLSKLSWPTILSFREDGMAVYDPPQPLWKRNLAGILDFLLASIVFGLLLSWIFGAEPHPPVITANRTTRELFSLGTWPTLLLLVLIVAYFIVLGRSGGTVFQRIFGMKRARS